MRAPSNIKILQFCKPRVHFCFLKCIFNNSHHLEPSRPLLLQSPLSPDVTSMELQAPGDLTDSSARYNAYPRRLCASSHAAPGTGQRQRESYLGCLCSHRLGAAGIPYYGILWEPTERDSWVFFLKGAIVLNNSPGSRKYSSICADLIFMYLCICIYLLGCVGSQLCMQVHAGSSLHLFHGAHGLSSCSTQTQ